MAINPKPIEFLNPTSNLTPAVAGGLTTALSAPVIANFETLKFPWVALIVSLIFALIMVLGFKEITSTLNRFLYCVLNTLIIFSVAATIQSQIDRKPPPLAPMPQKFKELACKILDETQMSANDREFIKNLLLVDSPGAAPATWNDILKPSQAWAQPGVQPAAPHPAAGPANRDSTQQSSPSVQPKPSPSVTSKDVKAAQEFRQQQQQLLQEQRRYYHQNTF
jgi:hypothetical protein